jgi:hypothetical protein
MFLDDVFDCPALSLRTPIDKRGGSWVGLLEAFLDLGLAALAQLAHCSIESQEVSASTPRILAQSLQSFTEVHENSANDFVGAFLDDGRDCGLAAFAQLAHCSIESQEVSTSVPRILAQSLHSFNDPHEISGAALELDLLDVGRDVGFAARTLLSNCSMFSGEVPTSIPFILAQSLQSFIDAHENSPNDFVGAFLDDGRDCGLAALAQLAH